MINTAFSPMTAYSPAQAQRPQIAPRPQAFGTIGKFNPSIGDFKTRTATSAALAGCGHKMTGSATEDTGFKPMRSGVKDLTEEQKQGLQDMLAGKHEVTFDD